MTTAPHFKSHHDTMPGRRPLGGHNPPAVASIPAIIKPGASVPLPTDGDPLDMGGCGLMNMACSRVHITCIMGLEQNCCNSQASFTNNYG